MAMLSPYPGMRPFNLNEHNLFFGREEQVDELLLRLQDSRFLAVVGPSGCGKSSMVRAGMMAALEMGYLVTAGSGWRFAVMRPGSRPIHRLAEALIAGAGLVPAGLDAGVARELIEDTLRRGPRGLMEVLDGTPLPADTNLLVLVDKFEEMFRFRREGNHDEADAFVALLLESVEQQEQPVYVVITLRSDFFGECAIFTDLPEAINKSQHLTPRLTREQWEAAIVCPARVFGGDVEPQLVNRLLNEMGRDPDQLPLLQHLLMRMWTWRAAAATSCSDGPVPVGHELSVERAGEGRTLTINDYESVGGLANALSNHAEEALAVLSESQRTIAEIMFRQLSEGGYLVLRRPTPVGEIAMVANVNVDEVVHVADVFRAPGCSFLVPAFPAAIDARTVLDITHESLIRQWRRLKDWIDAEAKSAESYRFLEQNARHWKQGRAALWGTTNLELALAWREEERPTAVWAKRYGGDFALAMAFLDASEQARRAQEAEAEARRQRELEQAQRLALQYKRARVAINLGLVALLLAAGAGWQWLEAQAQTRQANDERTRAEHNLALAQGAARDLVFDLAQELKSVSGVSNDTVRRILGRADDLLTELTGGEDAPPLLLHTRAAALNEFAQAYMAQGDLEAARAATTQANNIAQKLAQQDPGNAEGQRDLSISYERIGSILQAQGDLSGALRAYQAGLTIAERLAQQDPGNAEGQRALARIKTKLNQTRVAHPPGQ